MKNVIIATSLATLCAASCGHSSTSHPSNIFGHDDRTEVTSTDYPWRTVGHFSNGCTGTLVGHDVVLTAAHCIWSTVTNELFDPMPTFSPNMMHGEAPDEAHITSYTFGTTDISEDPANDWVVLHLDQYLGDAYGWMRTREANFAETLPFTVTQVGYSGDFQNGKTAAAHIGCHILKTKDSATVLMHDCDTTRGASGGPLFTMDGPTATIIGVNTSENRDGGEVSLHLADYDGNHPNFGVWRQTISDTIKSTATPSANVSLSIFWTLNGMNWGWGTGSTDAEAEAAARLHCGHDACVKTITVSNRCIALTRDGSKLWYASGFGRRSNDAHAMDDCRKESSQPSSCTQVVSECRH